jgi:hypothetical protein
MRRSHVSPRNLVVDSDRVRFSWAVAIMTGAAIGLALTLAFGLLAVGCYPQPPVNPPSCAQDPTQPWCAPPAFATSCTTFRVDIERDAGVKDSLGVWHYPARASASGCPDGGTK